jgi:hypothetical protein
LILGDTARGCVAIFVILRATSSGDIVVSTIATGAIIGNTLRVKVTTILANQSIATSVFVVSTSLITSDARIERSIFQECEGIANATITFLLRASTPSCITISVVLGATRSTSLHTLGQH